MSREWFRYTLTLRMDVRISPRYVEPIRLAFIDTLKTVPYIVAAIKASDDWTRVGEVSSIVTVEHKENRDGVFPTKPRFIFDEAATITKEQWEAFKKYHPGPVEDPPS